MADLTQKQTEAAVVMKRAVTDFSENFLKRSKITLRLEFPELEILLYSIEMKDNYFYEENFHYYLYELYRLSLSELRVQHNGTFHNYFMSLKNTRHLPHLKTRKIEYLFDFLKTEFTIKEKRPSFL